MEIDYNEQMLNYYPEVIKAIREFQELIKTQSLEIEEMHEELVKLLSNAYVSTADEETIAMWERLLGITPLDQGEDTLETWLEDRRETILARLYHTEKLNTKSISDIVKIFTGGNAVSSFRDGVITVYVTPPPGSKQYKFGNVERELKRKVPAHLILVIDRNYYTWSEVNEDYTTWGDLNNTLPNWEEVLFSVPV